jgi:hypothetical protein
VNLQSSREELISEIRPTVSSRGAAGVSEGLCKA